MACSVRETITRELRNNNFIDSKNNIIGNTSQVFPYIDSVNQFAKDNFGVTEDVLQTKSITNVAGARVKVRFNNSVVEQIDTNRESETFDSRYNSDSNNISYNLKAIDILSSKKGEQIFEKGKKANWDLNKILTELQVPKDQKALLLDLNIYF